MISRDPSVKRKHPAPVEPHRCADKRDKVLSNSVHGVAELLLIDPATRIVVDGSKELFRRFIAQGNAKDFHCQLKLSKIEFNRVANHGFVYDAKPILVGCFGIKIWHHRKTKMRAWRVSE